MIATVFESFLSELPIIMGEFVFVGEDGEYEER